MEGICVGKGIVIGKKFTFGSFGWKTMGNCVYNIIAAKQWVLANYHCNCKSNPIWSCN